MPFVLPILASIFSLVFAYFLIKEIRKTPSGTEKMIEISKAIREGAMAFLKREFKILTIVLIFLAIFLGFLTKPSESFTFLLGAVISALAGFLGMWVATQANVKSANSAIKSFAKAFKIAYYSGTIMGMMVVGLGLLGIILVWISFKDVDLLISYAFGSSLVALFLRVGGGMYTKSADMGADLVGKIEKNIPEDDPRNPAVIADAVGDNVGDVTGMGSDLFESYVSAIVATAVLGIPLYGVNGVIFPTFLAGAGILASIIGTFFVRIKPEAGNLSFGEQTEKIRKAMQNGILVANFLMVIAAFFLSKYLFDDLGIFYAFLVGLVLGILISKSIEYYTSDRKPPVLSIARSAKSGPSINIIEGMSQGMISTVVPAIGIAIAMILAFKFAGAFGITVASVGILAVLGINLSSDCYGPVVDNAAGIAEMAGLSDSVRQKTDALDSVGNTTAATGKGFAIGSAGLASLAWLAAFFKVANLKEISLMNPEVIAGLFIGAMISFLFSALVMRTVSQGAFIIVDEVRRQFKEIPGLMEEKAKPDYSKCVDITTKKALGGMILPGILVILFPILVGIFLGLEALGGFLVGALISGFLLAIMMANAGGAWDNAKKYIEAGNLGGKGSDVHKAAVVGDTVGDPFKDTSGPSLNILIKLIGKVALIFVPLFLLI